MGFGLKNSTMQNFQKKKRARTKIGTKQTIQKIIVTTKVIYTQQKSNNSDSPSDSDEVPYNLPWNEVLQLTHDEYLEDRPLILGEENLQKKTKELSGESTQHVRTSLNNIIFRLPGPMNEGRSCSSVRNLGSSIYRKLPTEDSILYPHLH